MSNSRFMRRLRQGCHRGGPGPAGQAGQAGVLLGRAERRRQAAVQRGRRRRAVLRCPGPAHRSADGHPQCPPHTRPYLDDAPDGHHQVQGGSGSQLGTRPAPGRTPAGARPGADRLPGNRMGALGRPGAAGPPTRRLRRRRHRATGRAGRIAPLSAVSRPSSREPVRRARAWAGRPGGSPGERGRARTRTARRCRSSRTSSRPVRSCG